MGTWNYKPFGNDTACDWVFDLEKTKDSSLIIETLKKFTVDEVIDSPDGKEMVAAASIVLAASKDKVTGLPKEVKEWVLLHAYVPSQPEIELAVQALQKIICADTSDLYELWIESGNATKWKAHTQSLIDALQEIDTSQLPTRKPKKKGIPRTLIKLCEHPDIDTNPKIKQKIREKLEKLDDVNVATKATGFHMPLILMSKHGLLKEVEFLVENKKTNIEQTTSGSTLTALCHAAMNNQLDVLKFLLTKGAKVNTAQTSNFPDIGVMTYTYSPPLFASIKTASSQVVRTLVEHGAELGLNIPFGESILHQAVTHNNYKIIQILHNSGIPIDIRKSLNLNSQTPLHVAVFHENYESVHELLKLGANPNLTYTSNYGEQDFTFNALDLIRLKPKSEIYRLLVDAGASLSPEYR